MPKQPKVLIHLTANKYGGVETHVFHLSKVLRANGFDVTLCSQRKFDLNDEWTAELLEANVKIVAPPKPNSRLPGLINLLTARQALTQQLPLKAFDFVLGQSHGGAYAWMHRYVRPGGLFLWQEQWHGLPTHGDSYTSYTKPCPRKFSWKMQRMIANLDGIITGCERAKANLQNIQNVQVPIVVVPPLSQVPGVLPAIEKQVTSDTPIRLVMVGRLGFGKGVNALLDVWNSLRIGPAELHFYGPLDSLSSQDAAKTVSQDPSVTFHGPFSRNELPMILAEADLGLMLSIEEGYGLAAWEYMACGLPFVITDCGAADEFTADNPDSIKVPVSRDGLSFGIEEMARRLRHSSTSRLRLQNLHRNRFSFESSANKYLEVFSCSQDYFPARKL